MAEIQTVGVVGAGTMGSGIAHVFARAGFRVLLCDVEQCFLGRAVAQIRANLGREAAKASCPRPKLNLLWPASNLRWTARPSPAQTLPLKPHRSASK